MSDNGQDGGNPTGEDAEVWEVRYDLWNWSRQERQSLSSELRNGGVGLRWEATELVVSPDDEDFVDGLVGLGGEEASDGSGDDEGGPIKPTASDHVKGFLGNLVEVALDGIVGSIPL